MNMFYNNVVLCRYVGLVIPIFVQLAVKNGIQMIELSLTMYIYFVQL